MFTTQARVPTERGEEYIRKLCKHFAHKVDASYAGASGVVRFGFATCGMSFADGTLRFECSADSEVGLRRAEFVVTDHLRRFAWHEALELVWE